MESGETGFLFPDSVIKFRPSFRMHILLGLRMGVFFNGGLLAKENTCYSCS